MSVSRALVVVFATLLVTATIPAGVAAQSRPPWAEEMRTELNSMVDRYNANATSLDLGIGDAILEAERVTVRVVDERGRVAYFNVETNGNKEITGGVSDGEHEGATLLVETDRATMDEISNANDPVAALKANVDDDDVTFEGKTAINWALVTGFSVAKTIADSLSKFL